MIFGLPWWVFMMILFIFFSGYMAFRAMKAEKELEEHYIERDGQVYMKRLEEERKKKEEKEQQVSH